VEPQPGGAVRMVTDAPMPDDGRTDATVRVRAQALDQLLDQAAEVLHGIARLREAARKLPENASGQFEAEIDRLRRNARDLHGRVMNARLTPFSSLTERLPRAVRDLAHRLGKEVELEVQGGVGEITEQQSYELAFLPGLSTREEATDLSGRGVGLDAVKAAVEGLGGKIGLRSAPGKGSRFTLELPLSVSMANLLLVQVGGELYGLPMSRVVATTEYDLSARGGEGF